MRRVYAIRLIGLLLSFFPALSAYGEGTNDYLTDDQGRVIRVAFPLHDRVVADVTARSHQTAAGRNMSPAVGFAIKHSFGVDFPEEEIWWRFRHTFLGLEARMVNGEGEGEDRLRLRSTLVEGRYLRHDESAFILVPANVDLRIPAPFDIALEYELLAIDLGTLSWDVSNIDIATFAIMLDFIRDPTYRHRLAIGPVMAYSMVNISNWTHHLTPMTGGRLIYGWEHTSGRLSMGAEVQCAAEAQLVDRRLQWQRRCLVGAHSEWTFLAVNDTPINLIFAAAAHEPRRPFETDSQLLWDAGVGLRWSLPGDRR